MTTRNSILCHATPRLPSSTQMGFVRWNQWISRYCIDPIGAWTTVHTAVLLSGVLWYPCTVVYLYGSQCWPTTVDMVVSTGVVLAGAGVVCLQTTISVTCATPYPTFSVCSNRLNRFLLGAFTLHGQHLDATWLLHTSMCSHIEPGWMPLQKTCWFLWRQDLDHTPDSWFLLEASISSTT